MDKVAFHAGGLTIYWYGVLVAAGFLAGLWSASRRAPRSGIAGERVMDLGPWLILGALVGARLLYVVSYWREEFATAPWYEPLLIRKGGLVFYGGLVGSSLACILYCRWKRLALWTIADIMAPSVALGYFFGRLGCLMNGCCYGRECDLPWAIHFPIGHETHPLGVHPTQLYESFSGLAAYLGLAWFYRHKHSPGQVFALYLMANGAVRFCVEFFRGDYPVHYMGGWATPAHVLGLALFATGTVLFWLRAPRQGSRGPGPSPTGTPGTPADSD